MVIDLRSDTITLPTPEMRKAMFDAELGDDVYGEDPTVNRLQELAAGLTGKEAALLVASGTMGNQVAILAHSSPGTEIILEAEAHIFYYEAAAASAFAGVQTRSLPGKRGSLSAAQVEAAIRGDNIHLPPTSLICLENTHNRAGGAVLPLGEMEAVYRVAAGRSLPVHLDGARLFNAAVAGGVEAAAIAACATSVQFCLSKGLGAPVGSLLCGSRSFIEEARRWRKRLGGGMRQAGIIAAAGLVALQTGIERLAEDHANARLLAEGLAAMSEVSCDPGQVETNIVIFQPLKTPADRLVANMKERGVLAAAMDPDRVRLVTSRAVDQSAVEAALVIINRALQA